MEIGRLKELSKALIDIMRLRNGLMSFFGVIIAAGIALSSGQVMPPFKALIAAVAAAMITSAGNVINDYFDFEIDKTNRPERPIPSGRVSRSDALMLSFALFMVGLGFAKYVNTYCLALAGLNSILLIIYGKYSKRMLVISNFIVSCLVASIFVFGALSVMKRGIEIEELRIIALLSSCAFLVTFSREITKDIEDIEGDKKKYCVTLPICIGLSSARKLAKVFVAFAIILSAVPFVTQPGGFDLYSYALPIIAADLIFIIAMTMNPTIGQRIMVLGMFLALVAFSLGSIAPRV